MSRMTHLCVGASSVLLLTLGLLWMPSSALAAAERPENGPDGHGCETIHKIAVGENLTLIAAQHEVTVEALIEENGIKDANLIVEGQSLCIPAHKADDAKKGPGNSEWDSYGVPGQSYDPSQMKKQEDHGPQKDGYGDQKSYGEQDRYGDQEHNGDQKSYGEQDRYGDQKNNGDQKNYGEQDRYGDQKSYGEQERNGEQENWQPESSWGVPGKSYDPEYMPKDKKEKSWEHARIFPEYIPRVTTEEPEEPEENGEIEPENNG